MVKLVAEQSEAERERLRAEAAREMALERIDSGLRELAANIMRVARGAGRPEILPRQAADFVRAVSEHKDAAGIYPLADVYVETLDIREDDPRFRADEHYTGQQCIIRGSLQMVASRLLGQATQESAGETEMYRGINAIEEARSEARKGLKASKRETEQERRSWDAVLSKPATASPPKTRSRRKT